MPYIGRTPTPSPVTADDIPDNSIDASKIVDGAITIADIADDAVTAAKLANSINTEIAANTAKTGITSGQASAITANTAKVTNATHTGDVTGATALTIADNAVTLAKMAGGTDGQIITYDASGNPVTVGPGTDGQVLTSTGAGSPPAFETAAGGISDLSPYFMSQSTTSQSVNNNTYAKFEFNNEITDSDGCYDTTNYRFTPTTAGWYYINTKMNLHDYGDNVYITGLIYKNGSAVSNMTSMSSTAQNVGVNLSMIVYLNGSTDYLEAYIRNKSGGTRTASNNLTTTESSFSGFKIG